jgi:glycosyltransferase involved in cell wall biosynthesis
MVLEALEVLENLVDDYEVIIVDDGSSDGSEKIAADLAHRYSRVRYVEHSENQGYGAALRTGLQSASKELVFYTDCDRPIALEDIGRALPLIESGADLVAGYRVDRYDTPRRFLYSKIYNFLCRLLFHIPVRDVNFSFKLLKRELLDCVRLSAGSVFIDGELLAEAVRCGYRVVEIPVEYFPRNSGKSSFDGLDAALYTLREMLAYWWCVTRVA